MKLDILQNELYSHIDAIEKTASEFPWHNKDFYAMWLRQTYAFVCHSTRLLTLASALCKDNGFHNRFMDHALEEKSHEKLIEKDFRNLKFNSADFPELLPTVGIYQIQYYWTQHVSPLSLFGYILLLEGLAVRVGGPVYEKVKKNHGDEVCNFIRIHVAADQDHLPKAFKTLEAASVETLKSISESLAITSNFYHESLKEILKGHWVKNNIKAA